MKIVNTYSFKGGEAFLKKKHPSELGEVLDAIKHLNATTVLTKESREKTMRDRLLFSPCDMNDYLKLELHKKGWTAKAKGKKKKFTEPRHAFGKGRFRKMDGIKNKFGLVLHKRYKALARGQALATEANTGQCQGFFFQLLIPDICFAGMSKFVIFDKAVLGR